MLTITEAASRLGVTRKTVYRRIKDGTLREFRHPARKTGAGAHYVLTDDVERLVSQKDAALARLRASHPPTP